MESTVVEIRDLQTRVYHGDYEGGMEEGKEWVTTILR